MNGKHASGRLMVEAPALQGGATLLVGSMPAIIARVADEDDARRLAAAWNAAGGMKTESVEELAEIGGVAALIVYGNETRGERDEARKQADDRALLLWALCDGGARWEAHTTELCIGGLCYSTKVGPDGLPVVHETLRAAILKAKARAAS